MAEKKWRMYRPKVGVVNVKLFPHDEPNTYRTAFIEAIRQRVIGPVHGKRRGLISRIAPAPYHDDLLHGDIATFTDIDPHAAWLNIEKGEEIPLDQAEAEIKIPKFARPDLKFVPFAFSEKNHRLTFDARSLTPDQVVKFVKHVLAKANPELDVKVQAVQAKETLDQIWRMHHLTTLKITIYRPNADDIGDLAAEWNQRMSEQRVDSETIILKSTSPDGLNPSPETKALAALALQDGSVEGRGVITENGGVTTLRTEDKPIVQVLAIEAADMASAMVQGLNRLAKAAAAHVRSRLPAPPRSASAKKPAPRRDG